MSILSGPLTRGLFKEPFQTASDLEPRNYRSTVDITDKDLNKSS